VAARHRARELSIPVALRHMRGSLHRASRRAASQSAVKTRLEMCLQSDHVTTMHNDWQLRHKLLTAVLWRMGTVSS
jgi:hypothetical protein